MIALPESTPDTAAASARLKAAMRPLTPLEVYEQRISWVLGSVSGVSREEVVKRLEDSGHQRPGGAEAAS